MMLLSFVMFCSLQYTLAKESLIVDTPSGLIQGALSKSYNGRDYTEFKGVPYAEPPIGNLRYENPEPKKPWSGVWIANTSSACMQISHLPEPEGGVSTGEEDCLHLDIFVPGNDPNKKQNLDVIVHIHGGALMYGAKDGYIGPKYIMDREVILVSINYRVGVFGFLSTEDDALPGNLGMKDQVKALKWIKDNIKHFGGNSDSITITGLSAGGASVHMHYLSKLSRGLFNRGISVSGCALNPWVLQEDALEKAKTIGNAVGCLQTNTKEMVECLKTRPATQLNEAIRLLRPWLYNPYSPFGIVVENHNNAPFLPDNPYKLLKDGNFYDVPWIISVTSEEGLYPAADFGLKDKHLPDLEKKWDELAAFILHFDGTIDKESLTDVSKKIKEFYLKDQPISKENFSKLIKLMSDRLFIDDCQKSAHIQSKSGKSPVYFYYYSYPGYEMETFAHLYTLCKTKYGVCHGDDMMFIFSDNNKSKLPKLTKPDENMKEVLLNIWTSFAKDSKPGIEEWLPVDPNIDDLVYLHIASGSDIKLDKIKELGHGSFWDTLPFKENANLYKMHMKSEL